MSAALFSTTMALKRRIEDATGAMVKVGAPQPDDSGGARISLTLFDVVPSAALRNVTRFAPAPTSGPVAAPVVPMEAIALDLRYLVSFQRASDDSAGDPKELKAFGSVIAALHSDPVLDATIAANDVPPDPNLPQSEQDSAFAQQLVGVSLESYGLDDWNRLWALFPDVSFRPSIVYLATPVFVTIGEIGLYPRVQQRESRAGVAADPPQGAAA